MNRRDILLKIAYPLLGAAIFVGIWWIAAACVGVEIILPAPNVVFGRFFGLFADGKFWLSLGYSVGRTLLSFALSFVLALALAVPAKFSEAFAGVLRPLVTVLRSVPTIAVILLILVFLPSGQVPVLISFLIVFPLLYEGFLSALKGVDPELAEMSRIYRVPKRVQIARCYIPAILPQVFAASRSALGLGLKVIVAAEALASTGMSLGRLMQIANVSFDSAGLLAYTIMAILVSFLLEGAVLALQKLVVRWQS